MTSNTIIILICLKGFVRFLSDLNIRKCIKDKDINVVDPITIKKESFDSLVNEKNAR